MRWLLWIDGHGARGAFSALVVLLLLAGQMAAAEQGPYLGFGASVAGQQFTYGKTVYTQASLARGESTSAESDADHILPTLAVFGGFRWQLPWRSLHLSAELDAAMHPSKLNGYLEGTGYTWTDTWPEDWWLKRNHSYGLTLKLGGPPGQYGLGLYALVGMRHVATEFAITETGCPGPELECPPTPLASFSETVERKLAAWRLGAGLERQLSQSFAVQLEVFSTDYRRKSWDRLFEGGVVIPSTVNGTEVEAALRLVRRF